MLLQDETLVDPEAMRNKARELSLDKREAEIDANLVGTETYDSGRSGGGAGGTKTYVQKLKDGSALPSAAEIDRMTAGYARRLPSLR